MKARPGQGAVSRPALAGHSPLDQTAGKAGVSNGCSLPGLSDRCSPGSLGGVRGGMNRATPMVGGAVEEPDNEPRL